MGRMFADPWVLGMIVVAALLLFAAPKLPTMAKSLGQSMRIFKSEVKQMKDDVTVPGVMPKAAENVGADATDHQDTPSSKS